MLIFTCGGILLKYLLPINLQGPFLKSLDRVSNYSASIGIFPCHVNANMTVFYIRHIPH